eukprot:2444617-Pyramimonas_sp.AAC.1
MPQRLACLIGLMWPSALADFSQVLPFVIPFMVSGPDYVFHSREDRWRRKDVEGELQAPWVSAAAFTAAFARRCESQCRRSWDALPIIRSVNFKYAVETAGSSLAVPMSGLRGAASELRADRFVAMAKHLYEVLHRGKIRYGNFRVPLNGDTSRLHLAEGLTKAERQLARRASFVAEHFAGTQQCRQLMGHRHFGARLQYGDCFFFTLSPNEKHSAWVLRLSRTRVNDPAIRCSDPVWRRLCGVDYPELFSKRASDQPDGDAVKTA